MAGKEGFSADSWCSDCSLYKAKRMPRKREEQPAGAPQRRLAFQVLTRSQLGALPRNYEMVRVFARMEHAPSRSASRNSSR